MGGGLTEKKNLPSTSSSLGNRRKKEKFYKQNFPKPSTPSSLGNERKKEKFYKQNFPEEKGVDGNKHFIRLHNDSIAIKIFSDREKINGKKVRLKYTYYKLIIKEDVVLKVYEQKTVVQFRKDIVANTEQEAKNQADLRLQSFLKKEYGLIEYNQLSRHYGLLGTDLAKKIHKEGKKVILYDKIDGKVRQRIDFSNDKPEIDSEHVIYGQTDSEKTNSFLYDIINKPHYLPSDSKILVDGLITVSESNTKNIGYFGEHMVSHVAAIQKLGDASIKNNDIMDGFKIEVLKVMKKLSKNIKVMGIEFVSMKKKLLTKSQTKLGDF